MSNRAAALCTGEDGEINGWTSPLRGTTTPRYNAGGKEAFFFQGCQARSLWCRRRGDASPKRLGLCGGISTSICLAAVRRSQKTPRVCPNKHTKRKPPILSVKMPKLRHMHCHLDYATLLCAIETISSNAAEVFLAQRRVLASEGRRSLQVPWRMRFSQCVKVSRR